MRSQGPLHPKIQFRPREDQHRTERIQPTMKFTNVTDKQRLR